VQAGRVIAARFELESLVASGGMADVFRARELVTGQRVALKVLRSSGRPGAARFRREAAVLARLKHPHIVRYVAHGSDSEGNWLAMEWLDGESLEGRLSRGQLTPRECLVVARGAAEALTFAHECGVLHRDVKPSNLFLPGSRCEDVKVLDFGIARVADATLTRTGPTVGTPSYMSPEQARGIAIDARSDLFALGCVLFEALTGRRAFSGPNALAVLAKILLHDPPPVQSIEPRVPPALAALVGRLLAKDPSARPASASALVDMIDALIRTDLGRQGELVPKLTDDEQRLLTVVLVAGTAESGATSRGRVDELVSRSGGRAEWLPDSSLVVVLSGHASATDQATLAARHALAIREELRPTAVAVATGRAILPRALPCGEVIDRAASLLRGVDGGAVILDDMTRALLDARFEVESHDGRAELRAERRNAPSSRSLLGRPSPFVGRERELASLEALFTECLAEPAARAAVVVAPPGYGKSRLANELLRRLAASGRAPELRVARGDPMSAGSPFSVVGQFIVEAAGIASDDSPEVRRVKLRERLGTRLPPAESQRVAEFLGELVGAQFPSEESVQLRSARSDRMLMGDQLRRAFEDWIGAEAGSTPLVLVIEDLHWGDLPSIRLLDAALRAAAEKPLFVLALARPEIAEQWPDLWSERGTQEIRLGKLPRRSAERLVREVLGDRSSVAEIARLVDRADGNVLYLEELIRTAATTARTESPPSVLAMITTRLESLEPPARRVLRCASIFGEMFWRDGVLDVVGSERAPEVDDALRELTEREILTDRVNGIAGRDRGAYAFRHALVRDAAYAMLTEQDRRLGHLLAGSWLERRGNADPLALAEHFEWGGARERAVVWYHRAALAALQGNDLEAATARVDRAIASGAAGETLDALRVVGAEAHNWGGQFARARDLALAAYRSAPPGSATRNEAIAQLAVAATHLSDRDLLQELAHELLESDAAAPWPTSRCKAYSWLARGLVLFGERRLAVAVMDRVVAAVEGPDDSDPWAKADVEQAHVIFAICEGAYSAALRHIETAGELFGRAGDLRNEFDTLGNAGFAALCAGDYSLAERSLNEFLDGGRRFGVRTWIGTAQHNLGVVLAMQGRLDEALAIEREAVDYFVSEGTERFIAISRMYLAIIFLLRGDLERAEQEARSAVQAAGDASQLRVSTQGTLAQVLLDRNRPEEALHWARSAERVLEEIGMVEEREIAVRLVLAEALAACGEATAAREKLALARDRLMVLADRIDDENLRRCFLTKVPENARTLALAAQWLSGPASVAQRPRIDTG
jgi:eukaryotic-like serine/threonine-protein kinase